MWLDAMYICPDTVVSKGIGEWVVEERSNS
jgi:hypothetical protein